MMRSYSTVDLAGDRDYLSHHFNCPTCCAAGRSHGQQPRCQDGLALWEAYKDALRARIRAERATITKTLESKS